MDRRIIIVGGGRVGFQTAEYLEDLGHTPLVVERDPDRCEEISDAYVATVIEGDGTRPDILRQADPESADAVAALTANPGTNLGVCVMALRLNPELRTVMRVETVAGAEGYEEIVDEVVFPERAGSRVAVNALTGSASRALESLPGDLDIVEMRVFEGAPVEGRSLSEVALPRGSLVVSDAAADRVSQAETVLEAGETYLVAVEPAVADEVTQLFQG